MSRASVLALVLSVAGMIGVLASAVSLKRAGDELERVKAELGKTGGGGGVTRDTQASDRELRRLKDELERLKAELEEAKKSGGVATAKGVTKADLEAAIDAWFEGQRRKLREKEAQELEPRLQGAATKWIAKAQVQMRLTELQAVKIREAIEGHLRGALVILRETADKTEMGETMAELDARTRQAIKAELTPEQGPVFEGMTEFWHGGLLTGRKPEPK